MPLKETPRCPACDGAKMLPAFEVGGFAYLRCVSCRTHFVSPPPEPALLENLYSQTSYYDSARHHEARLREEGRQRAARLSRMGARSVLDVGCASGFFLDGARDAGLDTTGIEPGPAGADAASSGHEVHREWLATADLDGRTFDAVTLWEVLEHATEPLDLLSLALRAVRPGGLLALSTPSMSGLPALLLGKRFPMVTPPEHLTLFSRTGLERILGRTGLRIERMTSFSNLGSEQIRSGLRRFVLGRSTAANVVAATLAGGMVRVASLMDAAKLGTEFEVYARREHEDR